MTKIQKLSEDLHRERGKTPRSEGPHLPPGTLFNSLDPLGYPQPGIYRDLVSARESRENNDLIEELRTHVQHLSKSNNQLKTKLYFFKTLHEAETRKRTPYDHIPPRIETGLSRGGRPSSGSRGGQVLIKKGYDPVDLL